MSEDRLVLLKEVLMPPQAHIIRSALEASNIQSFVLDDNPAGLGVGIGIVNTRIMVLESDLKAAQKILEDVENDIGEKSV